ncbi:hypothetical protein ACQKWADRAFT_244420 [Trichoderma austrokoningii]
MRKPWDCIAMAQSSTSRRTRQSGGVVCGGTFACSTSAPPKITGATRQFTTKITTPDSRSISTMTAFLLKPPLRHQNARKSTDMAFCLLRFEVAVAICKLNYHGPVGIQEPALSTAEKRDLVERIEKRFYEWHINCCDITKPFDWVSAAWARLMLSKMWLAVSNPLHPQDTTDGDASLTRSL